MRQGGNGGNCPLPPNLGKFRKKFERVQSESRQNKQRKNMSENIKIRAYNMLHTHVHTHTLSIELKEVNVAVGENIKKII